MAVSRNIGIVDSIAAIVWVLRWEDGQYEKERFAGAEKFLSDFLPEFVS